MQTEQTGSQVILPNASLNGYSVESRGTADISATDSAENPLRVNELQLLMLQIESLTAANRCKDQFLASLSHELRSPLASIQYGIRILRSASGEDLAVQRGMHELIERQARQMAILATDLLDVERIATGRILVQPDRIDLRTVLAKAVETVEPELDRRKQTLSLTWPTTSTWVMADAGRLEQVFINLLTNASKYTDPGGYVSLSQSADDRYATVRIKDSGIGIAAHALPHIFDLYVQADANAERSRSGLGIGLALVRSIVHLHGGDVTAASAGQGQGSEFIVRLPARA